MTETVSRSKRSRWVRIGAVAGSAAVVALLTVVAMAFGAPSIPVGAVAPHGDRGVCTGCHTYITPAPVPDPAPAPNPTPVPDPTPTPVVDPAPTPDPVPSPAPGADDDDHGRVEECDEVESDDVDELEEYGDVADEVGEYDGAAQHEDAVVSDESEDDDEQSFSCRSLCSMSTRTTSIPTRMRAIPDHDDDD